MRVKPGSIIRAFLAGLLTGSFFLILIPALLIKLNLYLNLPILDFVVLNILGLLLIFAGILMFFYCSSLFFYFGFGTPAPIEPPKKLVVKGIYRHTRNPMYLGYFCVVLGQSLFFGHLLLFFYILLVFLIINYYLKYIEEPKLLKRFGDDYREYIKKTPRWFSFL